jgi:hypothetical protein
VRWLKSSLYVPGSSCESTFEDWICSLHAERELGGESLPT